MLCSEQNKDDPERKKQFEFAEKNFAPLYFIRSYPQDKSKLEMSFDLTCYQPQVRVEYKPHNPSQLTLHTLLVWRRSTVWSR